MSDQTDDRGGTNVRTSTPFTHAGVTVADYTNGDSSIYLSIDTVRAADTWLSREDARILCRALAERCGLVAVDPERARTLMVCDVALAAERLYAAVCQSRLKTTKEIQAGTDACDALVQAVVEKVLTA